MDALLEEVELEDPEIPMVGATDGAVLTTAEEVRRGVAEPDALAGAVGGRGRAAAEAWGARDLRGRGGWDTDQDVAGLQEKRRRGADGRGGASVKAPLGPAQIRDLIPHRYPFLLVDRIDELEAWGAGRRR